MRTLKFVLCLFAVFPIFGARAGVDGAAATVRLLSLNTQAAVFEIKLTNAGQEPIFLEESHRRSHNLHVVGFEIQAELGKWTYIGPKVDAAASSVFQLPAGASISRTVSISTSALGQQYLKLLKSTQPRYRARLRYFPSKAAWLNFARSFGHKSKPVIVIAEPPRRHM